MQFQLPTELQTELLAYDPKLKALAREQKQSKSPSKKAKYPLGNIPHVIPYEIVRESLQQDAIDRINGEYAPQRFHSFTTPVDVATPQARMKTKAILYHYEQCWYAAWLPPKGQENQYVYGYAHVLKDTAAARKTAPQSIVNNLDSYERIESGRTVYYVKRKLITRQDIANGLSKTYWRAEYMSAYGDKSREISKVAEQFRKSLEETIPLWEDSRNLFERLQCDGIAKALEIPLSLVSAEQQSTWQLTLNNLFALPTGVGVLHLDWRVFKDIKHILDTPFFRKWAQQKLDECLTAYNDPNNNYQRNIKRPFKQLMRLAEDIRYVDEIWPDCPIDYYQNHVQELLSMHMRTYRVPDAATHWLRKHMPVASFFNILAKQYEAENNRISSAITSKDYDLGINIYRFYEWNDTISMLVRVLDKQDLAPPKRWRITEFHDYVQAESWKIHNPNEKLPQDLFPEPIKVQVNNELWTFFQPNDTHQLAMWGQAVRNCVGSASSYAEGIRKKKHFIVLCMIESKPQFTIQLTVNGGLMSVDQIKGLSNQNLTVDQKDEYTKAFGQALQLRKTELSS